MTQRDVDYMIDPVDEPLRFACHRQRQDAEMDITPMIDITFLLLIFFLVSTRLSSEEMVDLPTARHGTAVSDKQAVVVTLIKGNGDDATIFKGDGKHPDTVLVSADLDDQQQEIEQYIQHGISIDGKQHVLIKAEPNVKHRDVARVARAAGDAAVSLLYVAVLEEQ